jgi:hypothetical protein
MKARHYIIACMIAAVIHNNTPSVLAGDAPSHLTLQLRDGSRILGTTTLPFLTIKSDALGQLQIPIGKLRTVTFSDKTGSALILLANGDKIEAAIQLTGLKLVTIFGSVEIPSALIREMQVTTTGGAAPVAGLVLHFKFDGNGVRAVVDTSPSNLRGEVFDAEVVSEGRVHSALRIRGADDYVIVRDTAPLDRLERELTVTAWVMPDATASYSDADNPHILTKGATFANLYADFGLSLTENTGRLTWEYSNSRNRPQYVRGEPVP